MVGKLLLAVQENYFHALESEADTNTLNRLGKLYYRVRKGIGFNKTPAEFGAFPTDPYSHTPKHAGAQQPGMTGQVKEEILTRFGELGIRVSDGRVRFVPRLLRAREFSSAARDFRYLDVDDEWQTIRVPQRGLSFTWCQVPIVYALDSDAAPSVNVTFDNGESESFHSLALAAEESKAIFERSGRVRRIDVQMSPDLLFPEQTS
jgi:hypothetical protein